MIGEECVVRALNGQAIALLLLVELALLLQAVLGEVEDDVMELVDLGDGGAERAQLLHASLDAVDQLPERSVDGARNQHHQHQASDGGKADGHAQSVVQRVACGEDGVLGEQPDDRPARVVIGHDARIQLQRFGDGVHLLIAHGNAFDLHKARIARFLKRESGPFGVHRVIERAVSRDDPVRTVAVCQRKGVAAGFAAAQFGYGEARVRQIRGGHLDSQHAVHLPVEHERHRVGDHPIAVARIALQHERLRPIRHGLRVGARVLQGGLVGLVEEVVGAAHAAAGKVQLRRPSVVKGDGRVAGDFLVPAFEQQVGMGIGVAGGVGVAQEGPDMILLDGKVAIVSQDQVHAAGGVGSDNGEQPREGIGDEGLLLAVIGKEARHIEARLGKLIGKGGVEGDGLTGDARPAFDHGAFQVHFAVVHRACIDGDGVVLKRALHAAEREHRNGQGALDQDDHGQRDHEGSKEGYLSFSLCRTCVSALAFVMHFLLLRTLGCGLKLLAEGGVPLLERGIAHVRLKSLGA